MYLPQDTELHSRYVIESLLGHGGFGVTYLARDLTLNVHVPVKEYLPRQLATRSEGATQVSIYTDGHSDCRKNKHGEEECLVSIWLVGLSDHYLKKIRSHRADETWMDIMPAPNMSPDGRLIVYTESDHEPIGGFRVINLQGQEVFRYPPDPRDPKPYQFDSFSPDSQMFVCYSYDFSQA